MENGRGNGAKDHGDMKDPKDMQDAVSPPKIRPVEPGADVPHETVDDGMAEVVADNADNDDGDDGCDEEMEWTEGRRCAPVRQDAFRNIVLGQIADGFFQPRTRHPSHPPHQCPHGVTDDELSRAALSHPIDTEEEAQRSGEPTIWRAIFLTAVILSVLAVLFCKPF